MSAAASTATEIRIPAGIAGLLAGEATAEVLFPRHQRRAAPATSYETADANVMTLPSTFPHLSTTGRKKAGGREIEDPTRETGVPPPSSSDLPACRKTEEDCAQLVDCPIQACGSKVLLVPFWVESAGGAGRLNLVESRI
jgi:hypothetical protein